MKEKNSNPEKCKFCDKNVVDTYFDFCNFHNIENELLGLKLLINNVIDRSDELYEKYKELGGSKVAPLTIEKLDVVSYSCKICDKKYSSEIESLTCCSCQEQDCKNQMEHIVYDKDGFVINTNYCLMHYVASENELLSEEIKEKQEQIAFNLKMKK